MDDLAQVSLRSLGAAGKVGLFSRRQSGPVSGFGHGEVQSSEKLALVKSDASSLSHYNSSSMSNYNVSIMDIYDIRRANLSILISSLEMSYTKFGQLVGYNGAYIGQLVNRTKRSKGGYALVTDRVVGKILAATKSSKKAVTREWFDQEQLFTAPMAAIINATEALGRKNSDEAEEAVRKAPPVPLVEDDRFPDHLSSTWPYMTPEQRDAIRYLEATFRAKLKA